MGFSAEMKDFIGAYEKGQKVNASRTDQDYKEQLTKTAKQTYDDNEDPNSVTNQLADVSLQKAKQSLAHSAAAEGRAASNHAATVRQRNPQDNGYTGNFPTGAINPQVGPSASQPIPQGQGALSIPIGPRPDMLIAPPVTEGPVAPSQGEYSGYREYEDGGLVPEEDDVEPQSVGAVPINPINQDPRLPPAGAPTDISARRRNPGLGMSEALLHDATKAGMTYGAKEYGLTNNGAVMTPAQQARTKMFAQGHGALSPQEMDMARKAVDPKGEMSDAQRNAAALGSVYQHWVNKGDNERAGKVAFQMLQNYRRDSQRYAAIAAHAAQTGDVDLATKAAMKAYANVPDGNDMKMFPNPAGGIAYSMTGPDGEEVTKGIATPQQMYAQASGLASGGFDKALLSAAGQYEETSKKKGAVKADKPLSPAGRKTQAEALSGEVGKLKDKWVSKNKDAPVDENYWTEATNTATHLLQQNSHLTDNEAVSAAMELITPNKANPEKKGNFKIKDSDDGDSSTVIFKDGRKIQISSDLRDQAINSRTARIAAAKAVEDKKKEEDDKPTLVDKIGKIAGVGGDIDQHALGMLKGPGEAIGTMGQIAGRLGKGAIDATTMDYGPQDEAVRNAAAAVADRFRNKGAIPIDDNDRPL